MCRARPHDKETLHRSFEDPHHPDSQLIWCADRFLDPFRPLRPATAGHNNHQRRSFRDLDSRHAGSRNTHTLVAQTCSQISRLTREERNPLRTANHSHPGGHKYFGRRPPGFLRLQSDIQGQQIQKPVKQELPVYAHRILEAFYAAFDEYPYLKGVKTEFEIDEIVMASDRPTPAVVKEKVVFAFGSSSLNCLTDYLLDQYPFKHQPEFYRFVKGRAATARDSGFVLKANGPLDPTFTAILPEVLTDDTHDYAVLLKHTREDTTYFVCAGLNVTASEASVLYLFKEWKLIRELASYRDFYILLQVDSDSKHAVERLRAVRERDKKQEYSFSRPLPQLK